VIRDAWKQKDPCAKGMMSSSMGKNAAPHSGHRQFLLKLDLGGSE